MRYLQRFIALALALVSAVAATGVVSATATPFGHGPVISWTINRSPNQGQIPFTWKITGLPARSKVVLQEPEGTGQVWQTVTRLGHKSTGAAKTPTLKLGIRKLRLAVTRHGHVIAARSQKLRVYGKVRLGQLIKDNQSAGTYTAPTFTFPYVQQRSFSGTSNGFFTDDKSQCREVVIDGVLSLYGDATDTSTLTIVQQSANPISASGPNDQLTTVKAAVRPGQSWSLNLRIANDYGTIYLNGYAVCFGRRQLNVNF